VADSATPHSTPRKCYLDDDMSVLQREHWTGEPAFLGNAWTMKKRQHVAVCELFSHQLGWELRLTIGELLRSQVCRSSDEVLRVQEEWRRTLEDRGYAEGQ
jgi:hypothetical protein